MVSFVLSRQRTSPAHRRRRTVHAYISDCATVWGTGKNITCLLKCTVLRHLPLNSTVTLKQRLFEVTENDVIQ